MAKQFHYECEHSHNDGHKMTLTWKHGIVMTVCFDQKTISILNMGEVKNAISAEDLSIDQFMGLIEQCQDMDDQMAKFNN